MSDTARPNAILPEERLDFEPAEGPTDREVSNVVTLAREQVRLENYAARLEAELKKTKEELRALSQGKLPLALTELGVAGLPLSRGYAVELREIAGGYISKERHGPAIAWLEKSGHGSLVKHTITITFERGDEKWARKFLRDLDARKKPIPYERKDTVHPQTLSKFVREQLAAAKEAQVDPKTVLPWDLLGVSQFQEAVIKRPPTEEMIG